MAWRNWRHGLAAIALMLAGAAPASAANWLEMGVYLTGPRYDGVLPECEAGLDTIASRFATKESRFWNSELQILGFEQVRQIAFRPWAYGTIPRRFCNAVAQVSDGTSHAIHYSILETSGWLGVGWGVEWCVVGLDRNWAYTPACKAAGP